MMEQVLAALIVLSLLGALIFSRLPTTWVFAGAMLVSYSTGLVGTEEILSKATNEGLITLILLMLMSIGLERLPWLTVLSGKLISPTLRSSLLRLTTLTAIFSAFVNNTAVVATLAGSLRKTRHHPASKLLLPLSYAAILGGTLTLIGTSTNLIVSSFLQDATGETLSFFAFFPVALPAVIAGIAVMILTNRILPSQAGDQIQLDDYLIEAKVSDDSKLIGKSIQDNGLRDLGELFLVEIARANTLISPVSPATVIEAGDRLIFSGDITRVGLLERFSGLQLFATEEGLLRSNMTEVVVMPNASVAGTTIKEAGFRSRFDAAVVGLRRDGAKLSGKLGAITLHAGDSLMLAVGPDFHQRSNLRKNFLVVDDDIDSAKLSVGVSTFISVALLVVVALTAMEVLPLIKGVAFLLVAMLAVGVLQASELRRRFPFEIWLVITSALTVSQAMANTGIVEALVSQAGGFLGGIPPYAAVVAVYFLTLLLTELMTNNAAAALMFPLAFTLSVNAGADPMPYVMAVAFGASASFLTPFGYTTNLMVQNLGGYRRKDYARYGLAVSVVYSAVVLALLPVFYPV